MTQRLHLVFCGELKEPRTTQFENVDEIDIFRILLNYKAAFDARKLAAQGSADSAHTHYFIAHLHRLRDEELAASPTKELA